MDKTATEVVLQLVASGMEKEAAFGGIWNTELAKQLIRDIRRMWSNNNVLRKLPDYNYLSPQYKNSMANKGLKYLDASKHGEAVANYISADSKLKALKKYPNGSRPMSLNNQRMDRRNNFEAMMKDVDPQGFIPKYIQYDK